MTKRTDVLSAIFLEKFYRRKGKLLKIIHRANTFCGTIYST
jgi:hypothetical protein